jgi:hypothetical protein
MGELQTVFDGDNFFPILSNVRETSPQCCDQYFGRFGPIFGETIGVLYNNQFSNVLSKKRQIFSEFFLS